MRGNTDVNQGVVPLRTILRNFLNLVDNCEASVKDGHDLYEKEFQELKQFSETLKSDPAYFCKEGEKNVNRKKNRYKDILPFDYTRVILGDYGDVPGSDYINANFIKGASGSSAYIACQGPLPHTVNDFWRMVVECEVQVIVMACNEQESGKHKCENYWVEEEAVEKEFGQVTIWLKKCRQVCPDFLVRTMRIRYVNAKGETEERNVCQFHYSAWPDHGVPTKVRPLLDMVRLIRDCQTSETLPVLVHCSAGCGRTGTICAIDYVWGLLRLGKLTPDFSLFCMVREMRRQRIAMVQTKDQYVLVHRAVKELFEEQLRIIDSHPYANVDHNGLPLDIKSDLEEPTYETVDFQLSERSRSSSVPPSLPPANHNLKPTNAKMEKEVENHYKYQEQEKSVHEIKSRPSSSHADHEEIQVASSEGDEKAEKEKEVGEEKRVSPTSKVSPIRNALLRKPSIVKLKAFFEKSKDEKKSGSTQLSRAKSDVSSRFHSFNSFASSFTSRGLTKASSSSNSPSSSTAVLDGNEAPVTSSDKPRMKPALLAKPALPVKRSKSLKLTLGESSDKFPKSSSSKHQSRKDDEHSKVDMVDSGKTNGSIPTSISMISNNPTKVYVKHVEIPKLQKAVSKSVKAESLTARTHEQQRNSIENGTYEGYDIVHVKKPAIPPKIFVSKESTKVPVNSTSPRIKMGVAKEMEDVHQIRNQSFKNVKLKKYDTVTPKSLAAANSGTTLTRSQSHVWQSTKTPMPMRIFSDENIYQPEEKGSLSKGETSGNSNPFRVGLPPPPPSSSSKNPFVHDSHQRSSSLESSSSFGFKHPKVDLELPREKPVVRKRVPKTNPYTNYLPLIGNTKYSPTLQGHHDYAEVRGKANGCQSINENIPKDLPLLKLSLEGQRSRENSSESSSNTGTPRNSLPGTPTRTIDSSYTQILKTNLQELSANGSSKGNGYIPPRSILKGSLSSTPSESDERLDSRPNPLQNIPHHKNILTGGSQPKINSIRVTVGVRERRNSFRQAVWKEEQPSHTENDEIQESPSNTLIFKSPSDGRSFIPPSATANGRPGVRTHKDYEPIWPEHRREAASLAKNHSNHSINGASNFMNDNRSHIPVSSSRSFDLSLSSDLHSRNEERLRTHPEFKSKFDEINNLLEELKTPCVHPSMPYPPTNAREMETSSRFPDTKFGTSEVPGGDANPRTPGLSAAPNLRHNRSLRTQRPQYQQGLSCFAFRKPSSFESITDQLHFEEYKQIQNPAGSSGTEPERRFVVEPNENRTDERGRISNDYVSLRQCHTSSTESNGAKSEFFHSADMPVPPPRTKNKRRQSTKKVYTNNIAQSNGQYSESASPEYHSGHINSPHGESDTSVNLPEIVRCSSNHTEDNQLSFVAPGNSGMHPTSPKSIFRAFGLVQAKAANMRSRFAHWTESKEKSGGKRSEPLLARDSEPSEYSNTEGGFSQSVVTSANQSTQQQPSKPKHQYL